MLLRKLGDEEGKVEKEIFEVNKKFVERINVIEKNNCLLKKIEEKSYRENINLITYKYLIIFDKEFLFIHFNIIKFKINIEFYIRLNKS